MYDIDDLIEPKNKKKNIFAKTWKDSKGKGESWQYDRLGDTYDQEGPIYGKAYERNRKGREAHIEMMDPSEYFEITGRPSYTLERDRIDKVKKNAMAGNKISLPWLEFEEGKYKSGGQEGHHRIKAAEELGAEKVPVVIANRDPRFMDKGWPMKPIEPKKKRNPFTYEEDYYMDVDY